MDHTSTAEQAPATSADDEPVDPLEELRRRIFEFRARGLTWPAIAKMVGRNEKTCRHQYKKAREEIVSDLNESGWKNIAGGRIRELEWAKAACRSHLAALEQGELDENGQPKPGSSKKGSLAAAIWMQTFLRALKQQQDYEMEIGFVQRASEKLDITLKDARAMSLEELQNECASLENQLARARIVPDSRVKEIRQIESTIDVTARVVDGQTPSAAKIEKVAANLQKKVDDA